MSVERYREVMAEHGLRGFDRIPWRNPRTGEIEGSVLGDTIPMRWRVSSDEWDRLRVFVEDTLGPYTYPSPTMETRLFGYPIEPDPRLPPNTIIFEPD